MNNFNRIVQLMTLLFYTKDCINSCEFTSTIINKNMGTEAKNRKFLLTMLLVFGMGTEGIEPPSPGLEPGSLPLAYAPLY